MATRLRHVDRFAHSSKNNAEVKCSFGEAATQMGALMDYIHTDRQQ